jgi:hypothetical protein
MRPALILAACAALFAGPAIAKTEVPTEAPAAATALTLDQPVDVNGITVACTGVGQTRADPQWQTFPVRVELANARAEYLVGATYTVTDTHGRVLLSVSCDAPWLLLKLSPGAYRVHAVLTNGDGQERSAPVSPPRTGQARFVLTFPGA